MKSLSIRARLVVLIALLIGVITAFISVYFPSKLEQQAVQAMTDKGTSIAEMTAFTIHNALLQGNRTEIEETLLGIRQNPDLVYLVVTNDSGRAISSFNEFRAEQAQYRNPSLQNKVSDNGTLFMSMAPVVYKGRIIGYLHLGLSLSKLRSELNWIQTSFVLMGVIMFIISLIAVYGISFVVTGPLSHMVRIAEQIAKGNYSRRAAVSSKDEIGHLARSFNTMVDNLESTRRELQYANRSLEARVADRTKEMLQEINERKQAEEKIREQAALLNIAQDAIIVRDLDDNILFWNKGAENLYGWKAEAVSGRKLSDLLHGSGSKQVKEASKLLTLKGEWRGDLSQTTRDGRTIVVESRWTLVRDNLSRPKSVLVVNTDITEKKMLENQFLRAQRMDSIGTLAGGIAHDLNNVLAPIMMAVQMFRKRLTDEHSQRLLASLESSAKRGADMVKQVLTFARGAEGERGVLQPKHLIREMENIVKETFPKSIQIETNTPKDLWTISGDATQLHQVLLNLSVNARDAMPDGGTLSLSAANVYIDEHYAQVGAQPGPHVVITVSDTGSGIPPEIIDRIFDPFFTTKGLGVGTGLGLSTVHSIIKSHGGFLNLKSELGKGTEFKVYLPANEAVDVQQPPEGDSDIPVGHGETILVVDDEVAVCNVTRATLESYGYHTLVSHDGREAVTLFERHKGEIKLIITDMMMPFMNGPEMIRAIRDSEPNIKIVGMSGLAGGAADLDDGMVEAFLPKPYSAEKLLRTIDTVLKEAPVEEKSTQDHDGGNGSTHREKPSETVEV
jgi:two-component system cell cycle sensor histidine kinase/response regulator CckA